MNSTISLEEISKQGEKYYQESLRDTLERENMGQFAVIDVEKKDYVTDADRLAAVEKARTKFGDKLFYIIQVGNTQNSGSNFAAKKYAWDL